MTKNNRDIIATQHTSEIALIRVILTLPLPVCTYPGEFLHFLNHNIVQRKQSILSVFFAKCLLAYLYLQEDNPTN